MTRTSKAPSPRAERRHPKDIGARKREHLRHIHRITHEQQIALVEEARAARRAEQARGVEP